MAKKCCSEKSCACVITQLNDAVGNGAIAVSGTGTTQDPYRVQFLGLNVVDSTTVDFTLAFDPLVGYIISGGFSATSKLDDLGDVVATAPTNGYVLGWNSGTGKWVPQAPTSAAPSAVHTDSSLTGDGSTGSPLTVKLAPGGGLTESGTTGLALLASIVNQLVRVFPDPASRTAASPAVAVNTFSALGSDIGRLQFWDGTSWTDLALFAKQDAAFGGDLLQLSGPSDSTNRFIEYTGVVDLTTDVDGGVVLISAASLTGMGAAGIKSLQYTPMVTASDGSTGTAHVMQLDFSDTSQASGVAYALDGTGIVASQAILGSVRAVLYAS